MIRTGYFAKIKYYKSKGFTPVSIARWTPESMNDIVSCKEFAPSDNLLSLYKKGYMTEGEYGGAYIDELKQLGDDRIRGILSELEETYGNVVLCCFEKSGKVCHRNILAYYCTDVLGIDVKEFDVS